MSRLFVKFLLAVRGNKKPKSRIKRHIGAWILNNGPGMINCRQFDQFLASYLDEELTKEQEQIFEDHMALCPMCRAHFQTYIASFQLSRTAFGELHEDSLPEYVPDELVDAVVATLQHKKG